MRFRPLVRLIYLYHERKISRKRKYSKQNKSKYIVKVGNHYDLPLCIDGWVITIGKCFNKGVYPNDAIGWEGEKGRWNAGFIEDNYDCFKLYYSP